MVDILDRLKVLGGYWRYAGGRYLAKLASGKVSEAYVNCSVLMQKPHFVTAAASDLCRLLGEQLGSYLPEDDLRRYGLENCTRWALRNERTTICGPAMGAVPLAFEVARKVGRDCIFTEPVYEQVLKEGGTPDGPDDYEIRKTGQQLKRFEVPRDTNMLFVEDVITTGKSSYEMMEAVWKRRGMVIGTLPYILCLVNRSGLDYLDGPRGCEKLKIISLADVQARTWDTVLDAVADLEKEYMPPVNVTRGDWLKAVRPKEHWNMLAGEWDGR